jgi:uncharacterized membrane protein YedE/YeeE
MLETVTEPVAAALVGLFGGTLLGLAARFGRFCTLGAIEDALYGTDRRRIRMWPIAIGVAIIGTFAAMATGLVEDRSTFYLSQAWNPLASILGGLVFGYGMALAGNCGYGALARFGGGDLRNFVIVLVMGLSAYATLAGPLAEARVWAFPVLVPTEVLPGFAHWFSAATGLSTMVVAAVVGVALIALGIADRDMLRSPSMIVWSIIVGIAIVSGWVGTSWINDNGFAPVSVMSHTYSAPLGESMLWVMTASGRSLSFGVGSVFGVLAGAFIAALIKGHFRWEACDDPRELKRQILGAAIMGVGAVVAAGCSVGQGLSAFSVLAWSAPVTLVSIFAGAAIGLRQLITGFRGFPED